MCLTPLRVTADGPVVGLIYHDELAAFFVRAGDGYVATARFRAMNYDERTRVFLEATDGWRRRGLFGLEEHGEITDIGEFGVDRKLLGTFGFIRRSCQLLAYTLIEGVEHCWIAQRAQHKRYPGMLDTTAGGLAKQGETAIEKMRREAAEEASLTDLINLHALDAVSTISRIDEGVSAGISQVYEVELSPHVTPTPGDDETECFERMKASNMLDHIMSGRFQPPAALSWMRWLDSHGYLDARPDRTALLANLKHPMLQ